jgi:hypothetical protein
MVGAPQGAMRVASQIWQVVLASQTLQVFCFGPSQKGTICSSGEGFVIFSFQTKLEPILLVHMTH